MRISKFILIFCCFVYSCFTLASQKEELWISTGLDTLQVLKSEMKNGLSVFKQNSNAAILKVPAANIPFISHLAHERLGRCGGFIVHENQQEAEKTLSNFQSDVTVNKNFFDYSITEEDTVRSLLTQLKEPMIRSMIKKLSSFHNRYYRSEMGVTSSRWIKDHWASLIKGRSDAKVELFTHSDFPQPSVILTIEGSKNPDEVVVIGGHADSIAGFWNRHEAKAPGADDNASGIAVMTEVLRVILENGISPGRTVKFMAYAAEEVGLLGSNEIATEFKNKRISVVGVLQLDMTNMKAGELDIVMMNDYTDGQQNTFIGNLIDHYVHVPWGYSKCGYGCSDHVSWTKNGFPASIPFETKMELSNKNIHTVRDTLESMGDSADHALKFAKLALAYMIEMAK